jgi:DNA-binding NarL/FixJ family response regulator
MIARPLSVGIVELNVLFRRIIVNYLSEQSNICVSAQVANVYELLSELPRMPVDVIVMQYHESRKRDAVKVLKDVYPAIKIVLLSMIADPFQIIDVMDDDVSGFVSDADDPEELLKAITLAAENRTYRSKTISSLAQPSSGLTALNDREIKMLQLIWEEKNTIEIAEALFLGTKSVEKIRQGIKDKTGAKSVVGLMKYALDRNFIQP